MPCGACTRRCSLRARGASRTWTCWPPTPNGRPEWPRRPKHAEGYLLSFEEIGRKIEELKALGGVQILMQGGHNPYIPFEWYLDLLRYIKRHHPIHIHGFSPSEIDFFAGRFGMSLEQV